MQTYLRRYQPIRLYRGGDNLGTGSAPNRTPPICIKRGKWWGFTDYL